MLQLHFSLLDLELHARYTPGGDRSVFDVDQVASGFKPLKPTLQSSDWTSVRTPWHAVCCVPHRRLQALQRQVAHTLTKHSIPYYSTSHAATGVAQELAKKTSVMQPLKEDRFLCGFSHIFAGGYSAGDTSSPSLECRHWGLTSSIPHHQLRTLRHCGAPWMSGV